MSREEAGLMEGERDGYMDGWIEQGGGGKNDENARRDEVEEEEDDEEEEEEEEEEGETRRWLARNYG